MILLDIVWPAIYVAGGLLQLWYSIIFTILIEGLVIYLLFKFSIGKSLLIATVGNLVSGLAGIFVMPVAMLLFHFVTDIFVSISTFGFFNWIVTLMVMCFGSVIIEVLVIKLIWKLEFGKLFIALMIGNLLTYILIAILIYFGIISMS